MTIHIQLSYNKGYKWFKKDEISVKGYLFTSDNQYVQGDELIHYFSDIPSFSEFQRKLQQVNGLFSVVIRKANTVWAAIDHGRMFPLFYYHQNDVFVITDNPKLLKSNAITLALDENNAMFLCYSGFVPGDKTLLKNVFQLRAGETLCYENGSVNKVFHTEFLTDSFFTESRQELKETLQTILERVGQRLVSALNGRTAVIPLSGGFDSRLLAWLLRKNNYPNVICFTYGTDNTPERNNAQRTADSFGYEWHFINYEKYFNYSFREDALFQEYVHFAANYAHKFYMQEYFAIKELLALKKIPENAVFISGHSGAIAGHLLNKSMMNSDFKYVEQALEEVFSFVYPRRKDVALIRKEIDFLNKYDQKYPSYLLYENWRFQETTTKVAISSSKLWELHGYEFLHPLWDKELYDFFLHVPLQHKYNKNLYMETLDELFASCNISFRKEELYPSEKLVKKVSFRSKIKKRFSFLKYFVNPWKNDIQGTQFFTQDFVKELKEAKNYRKILSVNGIYSAWYVLQAKKTLS
jgi:asparagine synthase (glutamine-hydrolysing)